MTTNPCHGPDAETGAVRDLTFLQAAGAVRRFEPNGDGFVVELPDRRLLALSAEAVAPFRAGVLLGWRLPRDVSVPG